MPGAPDAGECGECIRADCGHLEGRGRPRTRFLYSGGKFTTLDVPGALYTEAWGINNAGQVVGTHLDAIGGGVFLYENGVFNLSKGGLAINDWGEIVLYQGYYDTSGNFNYLNYPGANDTTSYGINNKHEVVGWYYDKNYVSDGFLYASGTYFTVDFPSASGTVLRGISTLGQFLGSYTDSASATHGFVDAGGTFLEIEYPGAGNGTEAHDANDFGQIVGLYRSGANNSITNGFVATNFAFDPVPLINQPVAPVTALPGGSPFTLSVNGTGFVSGAQVYWNGGRRARRRSKAAER